ncbi:MAG: DNA topoisomerase IB [Sporichthyaceae bacterium]
MRLRRSGPNEPGIERVRCGRGFRYVDAAGDPVHDQATLDRIRALVLPPAWRDVWICRHPCGHLQAVGTDAAGRRQYRYHDQWRESRDAAKHRRILEFAACLPRLRNTAVEHLHGRGFGRERVLAGAVRLIDLGFFRSGSEAYEKAHDTYGIATVHREHVRCSGRTVRFSYPAKGSVHREQAIAEEAVCRLVRGLRRRRDPNPELLAWRNGNGWHDVAAADINAYLQEVTGGPYTAKDFRTWHATVLAAVGLAVSVEAAAKPTARRRAVARTVREVAAYLGNTPAVARRSYIDPRVFEAYADGETVAPALRRLGERVAPGELATIGPFERSVARMLAGRN